MQKPKILFIECMKNQGSFTEVDNQVIHRLNSIKFCIGRIKYQEALMFSEFTKKSMIGLYKQTSCRSIDDWWINTFRYYVRVKFKYILHLKFDLQIPRGMCVQCTNANIVCLHQMHELILYPFIFDRKITPVIDKINDGSNVLYRNSNPKHKWSRW